MPDTVDEPKSEAADVAEAVAAGVATDQQVAERLEHVPAQDAAAVLADMPRERAADVAEFLQPTTAAEIVAQLDAEIAGELIEAMDRPEAALVLAEMDPDDRVDVLDEVDEDVHDQLVAALEPEERAEVERLEQFEPDTAGGIMTLEVTALYEGLTVGDAIEELRTQSETLEQMFYVYVVDRRGHLVGVLSMRDLILARPARVLNEIMIPNVKSVPADMDQEAVAHFMRRYGYLAVPVVDAQHKLVGIITADDVQDVLEEEATEDVQVLFGAGAEERLTSPWTLSFQKRVGWLGVNLATAFGGAAVVGAFAGTIERMAVLAAFLPIVSAVGGNASVQAMAVTVRGLSAGDVDGALVRRVLVRELKVGVFAGASIGALMFGLALLYAGNQLGWPAGARLGGVVALAMLANLTLGCVVGTSVPMLMHKLGFDPAQSATIFTTALTDAVGFLLLLSLAAALLL